MTTSFEALPRLPLAHLPTPLQSLPNLSKQLGIDLWVKRDDLTGLAFGGNKTRKLELLVADALNLGADTLITTGAIQSNHCRQTAAAAAKAGLICDLVLVGEPDSNIQGNWLLDELLEARIHWTTRVDQASTFDRVIASHEDGGRNAYLIPYGGSNSIGVAAYALAMQELMKQDDEFDLIVLASSSGGTQAGLILGAALYGFTGDILGISIEPTEAELEAIIKRLLADSKTSIRLELDTDKLSIKISDKFLGAGYAVLGDLERKAIATFAQSEGLLVDPVYTGRAAGGMLSLINEGEIEKGQRVLFWHTGGTPALFAHAMQLVQGSR